MNKYDYIPFKYTAKVVDTKFENITPCFFTKKIIVNVNKKLCNMIRLENISI